MAITAVTPNYSTQLMGVDLLNTFTPDAVSGGGAGSGYDNPPHAPLEETVGMNGVRWMYVFAATIINAFDCVMIDGLGNASQATKALADTIAYRVGFSQIAIAASSYGWVGLNGTNLKVSVLTGTSANAALYTTATAGVLSSTSTSQDLITGAVVTTANSSGGTLPEPINSSWPRLIQ